jgi:hypothetical protein
MFADDDKSQLDRRQFCIILLDVAVKDLQQFGVNQMKIFTNYDANFVRLYRDNVNDLLDNFVPNEFGVASQ